MDWITGIRAKQKSMVTIDVIIKQNDTLEIHNVKNV